MTGIQDDLFDALADEQRRRILFSLVGRERSVPIDSRPDGLENRGSVALERRHVHIPKLEEYGFVEWDRTEDAVERGPRFEEIRSTLRLLVDNRETLPVASA